jgi:hypothetical protein
MALWVVDANQLLLARELGIIEKLPYVSHDSLDDHSSERQGENLELACWEVSA